jgi:hypothetical protein
VSYEVKTYVVQKADADGALGELLAVKLTFAAAHAIARRHAPAGVCQVVADKTEDCNVLPLGRLQIKPHQEP